MNDINALDCPFCGNDDIHMLNKYTGNYKHGKPVYIVFAQCSLCHASSRAFSYTVDINKELQEACNNALEAWNLRK
jgi:Lar family restriction alleviation protein